MNANDAVETVRAELVEKGGLLYKIALNNGIDRDAFQKLKAAMLFLADYYSGKSEIPKSLASAFIDLTPLFERSIDRYSEDQQFEIEDIRNEIVSLAEDIFS